MKILKRISASAMIIMLILLVFIGSYCKGYSSIVYADTPQLMTDEELEAAYQAYLQSRGGGFLGNAGARIAYLDGKILNFIADNPTVSLSTGIANVNDLKNSLSWNKATFNNGDYLQLTMGTNAVEFLGLYTSWLLQNHYFGNGVNDDYNDTGLFEVGTDNEIYNGELFTDNSNHSYLIYKFNTTYSEGFQNIFRSGYTWTVTERGTNIQNVENLTVGSTYTLPIQVLSGSSSATFSKTVYEYNLSSWGGTGKNKNFGTSGVNAYGARSDNQSTCYVCIAKWNNVPSTARNPYKVACITIKGNDVLFTDIGSIVTTQSNNNNVTINNVDIDFYTNNNMNITDYPDIGVDGTLKIIPKVKVDGGDTYEYYTINEGDNITNIVNNYYNDSGTKDKTTAVPDTQEPQTPPGGTLPNWNNPYPNLSPDGDGGFNINFTLPDLNIDWNINGLSEKFPFSIPFDLIAFIRLVNVDPQTPEISGRINLLVYQWDMHLDLHQFDSLAVIVRNVEFIGFCITLIMITRKLIKG